MKGLVPRLNSLQIATVIRVLLLALICICAFAIRLFSVLRYESFIHEFDPYFNYRLTLELVSHGFYEFHNWFDASAWYPLGRIVGATIYPGLMISAAVVYHSARWLHFAVDIRWFLNIWARRIIVMGQFISLFNHLHFKEPQVHNRKSALVAAAFVAIVPGYVSRRFPRSSPQAPSLSDLISSVAGSFDNEGVAICIMITTYALWLRSVNSGSMFWASMASLSYFYMVSAWGGYVFVINLIPMHVLVLLATNRSSVRLYITYSTFYILGTLMSMNVTCVGFRPIHSSEHMLALGTFGLMQISFGARWGRKFVSDRQFYALMRVLMMVLLVFGSALFVFGTLAGFISPWEGSFYALFDPTYAKRHIPIIASVAEHQPTTWASYFFDLHILVFLLPVGLWFVFNNLTDTNIFLCIYATSAMYFSGTMVRLMIVLAPIASILGGIAVSETLSSYAELLWMPEQRRPRPESSKKRRKRAALEAWKNRERPLPREISLATLLGACIVLIFFGWHCVWVTSEAYSSPSIVLTAKQQDGTVGIFDDFREAYRWIDLNTPKDSRIMSWWDYGYQLAAMANRTVLVDNNTWNNTAISVVGRAFASSEEEGFKICRQLDVDYVVVVFGGLTGYSSDDINKFLWMVRIANSTSHDIVESDYLVNGQYRVDASGSPKMLNSLMYKLSYYNFWLMMTDAQHPGGYDRVRNAVIGNRDFSLHFFEEAYTSEHWIVRVYKVLLPGNRG